MGVRSLHLYESLVIISTANKKRLDLGLKIRRCEFCGFKFIFLTPGREPLDSPLEKSERYNKECYSFISKRRENATRSSAFLKNFEVFENVVKHGLGCLI